jgi:hypothetical protein
MNRTTKSILLGVVIGASLGALGLSTMIQRDQTQAIQAVSGEIRAMREETTAVKERVAVIEQT